MLVFHRMAVLPSIYYPNTSFPTFTYMGNNFSVFGFKILISSAPLSCWSVFLRAENYVQAASTVAWAGCPNHLTNSLQIKSHQKKYYSLPFHCSTSRKEISLHPGVNWGTERVCAWKLGNPAASLIFFLLSHSAGQHAQEQNKLTSTKLMVRYRATQYKGDLNRMWSSPRWWFPPNSWGLEHAQCFWNM